MRMKIRQVKPEFFQDRDLSECEPDDHILFIGLWCAADRDGICEDDADLLKTMIFPRRRVNVEAGLTRLQQHGMITRYSNGKHRLLIIPNFSKHQSVHRNEGSYGYPKPDGEDAESSPDGAVKTVKRITVEPFERAKLWLIENREEFFSGTNSKGYDYALVCEQLARGLNWLKFTPTMSAVDKQKRQKKDWSRFFVGWMDRTHNTFAENDGLGLKRIVPVISEEHRKRVAQLNIILGIQVVPGAGMSKATEDAHYRSHVRSGGASEMRTIADILAEQTGGADGNDKE